MLLAKDNATPLEALKLLGWWPIGFIEVVRALALTAILFTGPLFERGIAEGEWRDWARGRRVSETLRGWIGWRNYVAVSQIPRSRTDAVSTNGEMQGPITEEIMFRSAIVPLHLLAKVSPGHIVFMAPLYFGIAHVHHFYEFRLTHPDTSVIAALFRSVFQFTYTTIFGWYATFLYLRTGSILAAILAHTFCNWCGLPRLWGRVEAGVPLGPPLAKGKEDPDGYPVYEHSQLGISWSIAYYTFLVVGAISFYCALWPLTDSPNALDNFAAK
ncbi:hypothetical protein EYZ11_003117 [Aspergillus tanneri]|uniref:intramembrane prenyl-peptidase Rce1 n=1 Tax=Aspergillus tanneri TaxID=1220188 RepID=A0A4S3JP11_9EURO|nr:hypothetical protein EYZ11_003117 [Aspergillus tanneri]